MKRIFNFRVVEGDPNEVTDNELLVIRDYDTGKIKDIQKRNSLGKLESIISGSIINSVIVTDSQTNEIYNGAPTSSITTESAVAGAITIKLS